MNRCALSLALCKAAAVFYNTGTVSGEGISVIANTNKSLGHSSGTGDPEGVPLPADNFRKRRRILFLPVLAYLVFGVCGSLMLLRFHRRRCGRQSSGV